MLGLHTVLRSVISRFGGPVTAFRSHSDQASAAPTRTATQEFLAAIADLPPDERQRKVSAREWYKRLAQRQGIMEVEEHPEHHRAQ